VCSCAQLFPWILGVRTQVLKLTTSTLTGWADLPNSKKSECAVQWWLTPLIPALGRQRQAWSTEWVPGQPGPHRRTLSRKTKKKKKKKEKEIWTFCQSHFPPLNTHTCSRTALVGEVDKQVC
jgi:hypothetical protein